MKSMTKLMVVAVAALLAAALVVAPAAAREINSTGTIVYVGEENLKFNTTDTSGDFIGAGEITKLVFFSDQTAEKTIIINPDDFELKKSDVGTKTGAYYIFNKTAPLTEKKYAVGTVEIQNPSVTIDVVLADARKDSVDGKTVTRNDELVFKVENNLHGFKDLVGKEYNMSIDVTLPGGGVTNEPFGKNLKENIDVNGTTYESPVLKLTDAEAGTYTAVAKWPRDTDFYGKGFDSNTVTFEVLTKTLAISSNKDSVVRGNSFTVTITGESNQLYKLFIKPVGSLDVNAGDYPTIVEGQKGLQELNTAAGESPINRTVKTTAGGTRSIQFDTNTSTDDRQFTIRVEEIGVADPDYDEVKVRVEEGDVTITASGTGVYYMGEEITLSGTCTEGDKVYLFMTGPNLRSEGASILNPAKAEFKAVDVEADDTWSYKWNTGDIEGTLDAGGYTIWAVSEERWKGNLSDVNYATTSVHLNTGYLTATSSGATVAKGDELKITGSAMGDPDNVRIWIFGKNYYGNPGKLYVRTETVESDGSFEHTLKSADTDDLAAGQYFVIIQHPMGDGVFGVEVDESAGTIMPPGMNAFKITGLQASDAASAVINALDSVNVDDTYVKLTFNVAEPYIFIDPIADQETGSKFTITGTTNAAVGDKLIIDVTSAAFGPTKKTEAAGFGSVSGNVVVEKGDGANKWSFEVDAANLKPDQYIVKVECIETDTTATANFNIIEKIPTTEPVEVETTVPAGEETPTEKETTEPTPTDTPGFGALVALAGLGAVAFLVLRRD